MIMKEWLRILLDRWRNIYAVAIPSIAASTYAVITLLISLNKLNWGVLTESKNLNEMLDAVITFVSIVIGVFGFLLPILIANKKDCGMVDYFFAKADLNKFTKNLKRVIMSGFIVIINSAIMFMNDIISNFIFNVICFLFVWFLLYFMCNSYRFISILLSLFMIEKKERLKEEINTMPREKVKELNETIKKK